MAHACAQNMQPSHISTCATRGYGGWHRYARAEAEERLVNLLRLLECLARRLALSQPLRPRKIRQVQLRTKSTSEEKSGFGCKKIQVGLKINQV